MSIKLLSLSGGGWNSMSNLAGALAGSIDRLEKYGIERKVDTLLSDYDYIAGNSGGTWFLTSLSFSDKYRNSIESRNSADTYNTSGFNNNVKNIFNQIGYLHPSNRSVSVGGMLIKFKSNWGNFVEKTVYEQLSDKNIKTANFNASGLADWALDKNLTFATAVTKHSNLDSTGKVISDSQQFYGPPIIQGGYLNDKVFASYAPRSPDSKKYDASNFAPLSIEINKNGKSIYRITDNQSDLSINYSNNQYWGPSTQTKSFSKVGSAESIKAISPSLASSAAVAAGAFPAFYGKTGIQNQAAYTEGSLAPIISFKNQSITKINQEPKTSNSFKNTFKNIAKNGYIRTADGGYLDNTSVAFNLSSAFHNREIDKTNGFEISLFQNSSESLSNLVKINGENKSAALLPSDLAALFGLDKDPRSKSVNGVQIHPESGLWTLSPQVFTSNSLTNSDLTPIWNWKQGNGGDIQFVHYTIDVETVANDAYGIEGGVKGALNVYLSMNPSSDAIPYKKEIHQDYIDNYNSWRTAINNAPDSINFFDSLDHVPVDYSGQKIKLSSSAERVIGTNKSDNIKASAGDDYLSTGNGRDILNGGEGDDYLCGGNGKDLLIGGQGADTLSGGAGVDTFRYRSLKDSMPDGGNNDTILKFKPGSDKIDLRPLSKDLKLRFIEKDQFEKPGDIRVKNGALHLNADDDMQTEFKIKLSGTNLNNLSADDFLLHA